jgi:hypothetical protein
MPQYKKYTSKDFVIFGSHLELNPETAWLKIHKDVRTAIRKGRTFGIKIVKVAGDEDDIKKFYPFTPNREDLPKKLSSIEHMYFAYLGEELLGGIIVTEMDDYLYLHFHASTEHGKKMQTPSLLMWHIVEEFKNTKFKYLDVGASYRPSLMKYFSGWATRKYPIIMHAPEYKPQITINPFEGRDLLNIDANEDAGRAQEYLKNFFGTEEYTFFPRGMYAIYALFRWMLLEGKISSDDEVCIRTTTESPYISSCVTSAIEQSCKWNREITEKTKAIFAIHEFGFPHPKIKELREVATQKNIPLVEDCAYAWGSGDAGKYGDFVIYSLTKIFPVKFGGFLVGKKFDFKYMWQNFACADLGKEEICLKVLAKYLPEREAIAAQRAENFRYYEKIFGNDRSYFQLENGIAPGAYMLKMKNEEEMKRVSEFVRQFGVECGNYWQNGAIFLPVHQNLRKPHLDYIGGAVYGSSGYEEIVKKLHEEEAKNNH